MSHGFATKQLSFFTVKISPKSEIQNQKFKNEVIFFNVSITKIWETNINNHRISVIGSSK
jgi:hypothetical protein